MGELSFLFGAFNPDLIFAGLSSDASSPVRALGAFFFTLGMVVATIGALLSFRAAKDQDGRMDSLVRVFVVVAMMFFAPWFVRGSRTFWNEVQIHYHCKPMQVATRCLLLSARFPELDSLFTQNIAAMQGNAAQQAADANAIGETLDRYGNGMVGQTLAMFQQIGRNVSGFFDRFNPLTFLAMAAKVIAALFQGMLKMVLTVILGLILQVIMIFMAIISAMMEILQVFLIIMGNMLLPIFIGMFALPSGNPFRNTARNFILHLLSITMWPLAWTIGHVGTMALFNAVVSAPTTSPLGAFSGVTFANITTHPLATAQEMNTALMQWQAGAFVGLLFLLIGIVMLAFWVFYVTVKLPFALNDLIINGADMVSQTASKAMAGAAQQAAAGAQAMGKEMQMAAVAAGVPLTGGLAAVGGAGGLLAGLGGMAKGGFGEAVSGFGTGRMQKDIAEVGRHQEATDAQRESTGAIRDLSRQIAGGFGGGGGGGAP